MNASYMERSGFYDRLREVAIIPVVVLERVEDALPLARALSWGGLPAAEITFRTSAAEASISAVHEGLPDVMVGAGTVLDVDQAKRAVRAGAQFIVSPGCDLDVVDWCLEHEVPVIPGAVTPTELCALSRRGVRVTKFFPAEASGGLDAVRALAGAFVGHRFLPTGGVSTENLGAYLSSPAVLAVGGTWMVKPNLFEGGDFSRVERAAAAARASVREIRGCDGTGDANA